MHDGSGPAELLAVFCANVIHIAPWRVAEGLFAGAGRYLRSDGRLFLYGPFKREGKHTAMSNAVFDTSLREQDAEWGVRDIADLEKLAAAVGLALIETVPMPANNMILVFGRSDAKFSIKLDAKVTRAHGARPFAPVDRTSRVFIVPRNQSMRLPARGLPGGNADAGYDSHRRGNQ